ncbi:outer membrane protein assembly factor BamB family protein [Rugamonas apoptosis]|uniref:PQQ-binding-like beta-propeller repeat protein n=1 Tax=Rugamonas apoptosis TaxID=2758570 RepID=A0A7W2F9Z3_9BURK|nr:PQQ-binding-like beta-propeller repeat protein [Rugamonas apoptosis]MBA5687883.1 PQQ-binding-like beta-propeller repeat protein [Rugamonas apoptosis]
MTNIFAAPLLLGWLLAGCGGGGGGGSSSTAPAAPDPEGAWLSFTVSQPEITGYVGESVPFTITATSSRTFAKPFNVAVIDGSGSITTDVTVTALSDLRYRADLMTSPTLASGPRQVNLEVRVCEDNPVVCQQPLPGSPWHVPVQMNLKSTAEAAKRLTLSESAVNLTAYPGQPVYLDLAATISGDLVGQRYQIKIIAPSDLITVGDVSGMTKDGFHTRLTSAAGLAVGNYSGKVEVRLCRDDPAVCHQPVPGSPWILPLTLAVQATSNQGGLVAVPGLVAWSTYQGNAAHTGYVPASFDATKFTRRWQVPTVANAAGIDHGHSGVAIDHGMVYLTVYDSTQGYVLAAMNEDSGAQAWRAPLGLGLAATAPAVANGQVYTLSATASAASFSTYDQRNGALLGKTGISSELPVAMAPNVVGTDVYFATVNSGTPYLSKFSSLGNKFAWRQFGGVSNQARTPAVDARNIYGYSGGQLKGYNLGTGAEAWSIVDPDYSQVFVREGTVIVADARVLFWQQNRLVAFDVAQRSVAWSVKGTPIGEPAYANGVVYATNGVGRVLEARAAADGALMWTMQLPGYDDFERVVVTRNLAFLSAPTGTVAVDLSTHQVVWRYPFGGELGISSNGILYILDTVGTLSAINLQ